ncbi:MAG: DUF1501 domain-containing protein [Marinicella sp.]
MKKMNRRNFIKGSGLVTIAGMGGLQLGFAKNLTKGSQSGSDLLVYVFLNGGMDGLHMVPPKSGANYTEYRDVLRPTLHVPNNVSLTLNGFPGFGMHPAAAELAQLFNDDKMCIIHATGLIEANRSHFEATRYLELGVAGASGASSGWLTRYFESSIYTPQNALIPSLVPNYSTTDAVLADAATLVMADPGSFGLNAGHWSWQAEMQNTLTEINTQATTPERFSAQQTLNASAIIQSIDWNNYAPGNGAVYPTSFIGDQLKAVAQLYKANVDLEVAYVPTGGWDTHNNQENVFNDLATDLSQALYAFYQDLAATHNGQFTVVVQSEFGRRAYQNSDNSTDHGYGNPMFIISDNVVPGFHGTFPGLGQNQLFEGDDVDVTVDYRDIVSEVILKRMGNPFLGHIFPGYNDYTELGVITGYNTQPNYDFDSIFRSGFEAG